MNNQFLYEYSENLEKIFEIALQEKYSLLALEREIAYSSYFQKIETDVDNTPPIIEEQVLVNKIFSDIKLKSYDAPRLTECMWAAEAYLRIQGETRLTFEAIFLWLPIKKMFELFPLYHEMDFSQIIQEFMIRQMEKSIFAILLWKFGYSVREVEEKTGIPYETLYSLKRRRRDIKKVNVEVVSALAKLFRVRIDTIAEIEQYKPENIYEFVKRQAH